MITHANVIQHIVDAKYTSELNYAQLYFKAIQKAVFKGCSKDCVKKLKLLVRNLKKMYEEKQNDFKKNGIHSFGARQ